MVLQDATKQHGQKVMRHSDVLVLMTEPKMGHLWLGWVGQGFSVGWLCVMRFAFICRSGWVPLVGLGKTGSVFVVGVVVVLSAALVSTRSLLI